MNAKSYLKILSVFLAATITACGSIKATVTEAAASDETPLAGSFILGTWMTGCKQKGSGDKQQLVVADESGLIAQLNLKWTSTDGSCSGTYITQDAASNPSSEMYVVASGVKLLAAADAPSSIEILDLLYEDAQMYEIVFQQDEDTLYVLIPLTMSASPGEQWQDWLDADANIVSFVSDPTVFVSTGATYSFAVLNRVDGLPAQ